MTTTAPTPRHTSAIHTPTTSPQHPTPSAILDDLDDLDALTADLQDEADCLADLLESRDCLEDLLTEALAQRDSELAMREARERRKRRTGVAPETRERDNQLVADWEMKYEWESAANVALFHRYTCKCGACSTVLESLMTRQLHRHLKTSQRWIVSKTQSPSLPNEVLIKEFTVPTCSACAERAGWDLKSAAIWQGE